MSRQSPVPPTGRLIDLDSSPDPTRSESPPDQFDIGYLHGVQKWDIIPKLLADYTRGTLTTEQISQSIAKIGTLPGTKVINLTPDETVDFLRASFDAFNASSKSSKQKVSERAQDMTVFEAMSVCIFEAAEHHAQNGNNGLMLGVVHELDKKLTDDRGILIDLRSIMLGLL